VSDHLLTALPLIDDLIKLWKVGVNTYDTSKREYFPMHTAVMCTTNNFSAYANLSGWFTKGYMGCPCTKATCSSRLKNCQKIILYGSSMILVF